MSNISMLQWLNMHKSQPTLSKKMFGHIMHDPYATEAEKEKALKQMEEAEGYENLPD